MPTSRLTYLFKKYMHNECSSWERYEFLQLLEENKNDEALKSLLAELAVNTPPHAVLPQASGDAILQSILGSEPLPQQAQMQQPAQVRYLYAGKRTRWMAVAAASIVLLLSVGYKLTSSNKKNISATTNLVQASKIVVRTITGESKSVQLPDGTRIWLSPSSELEYPTVFSNKTREVYLSGEAFFEVAHNKDRPFIIQSGTLKTKVLGTSFNIQAYDNQENIAVTVVTGKVNVSNDKKVENVELLPNQRAVFDKKTDKLIKENTDSTKAPEILKRKEGTFVYRDEPLQKVATDIETYFGVSIQVAEAIKQCGVGASFDITDNPESTLKLIAISLNATVRVQQKKFFIDGESCPH